jgi:hypothetical protein
MSLDVELIKTIQLHLKPRHLVKLLQTNKELYKLLMQHEYYWTRVATHLTWRRAIIFTPFYKTEEELKAHQEALKARRGQLLPHQLHSNDFKCYYDMVNLEKGYHASMEHFVSMIIPHMADTEPYVTDYMDPCVDYYGWMHLAEATLDVKVRKILTITMEKQHDIMGPVGQYTLEEIPTIPLLEICKREIKAITSSFYYNKEIKILINELDDNSNIPIKDKKKIGHSIVKALGVDKNSREMIIHHKHGAPIDPAVMQNAKESQLHKGLVISYCMACFTS